MSQPLISIGVPVHNEERFVALALANLRAQDYPNIEIIVSDNASADATAEICAQIAGGEDSHITLLRSTTNEGATVNFQRCLDAARGEFFMWAAGHDLWSTSFVSRCVEALARHPTAVVAVPESQWVDGDSRPAGFRSSVIDTRGMDPLARVFTLLWANMHAMYGLFRISALRRACPIPSYSGADLVLLLRVLLQGDFVPAPDALWSRRITRTDEDFKTRQQRYASTEFRIRKHALDRMLPVVRAPYEIMKTVWSSSLSLGDKIAFSFAFPPMALARYRVAKRRVI